MALLPGVGAAQIVGDVELTPFFASYYALGQLKDDAAGREKQTAAPALGANLTVRITGPYYVEGSVAYSTSGTVPYSGSANQALPGHLAFANVRLIYRGGFNPGMSNMHFFAGGGIVNRGGEAWSFDGASSLTNAAGVAGLGVRTQVGLKLSFDLAAEVHVYKADPDSDRDYYSPRWQQDVLVRIGIPIILRRP